MHNLFDADAGVPLEDAEFAGVKQAPHIWSSRVRANLGARLAGAAR